MRPPRPLVVSAIPLLYSNFVSTVAAEGIRVNFNQDYGKGVCIDTAWADTRTCGTGSRRGEELPYSFVLVLCYIDMNAVI